MPKIIVYTEEQAEWMRQHYATTKNEVCCEYLGVSMRTMIRYARKLGLQKDPDYMHSQIIENCKLMAVLNRGEGNAGKRNLLIYGVRNQFKPGQTTAQRIGEEAWERTKAKIRASRLETNRKERMRRDWGLPQRTKMKFGHDHNRACARHALKVHGYIVSRGANEIYYTETTQRSDTLERRAAAHGLHIQPIANN